ncbi:MAG: DUF4012 domain-containing protein [bacterium]|nr:DUF4012 domain-containing protein [bacterium]
MPRRNKKISRNNESIQLNKVRNNFLVPKANIIDLKNIKSEKDNQTNFLQKEDNKLGNRIRSIKFPKFSFKFKPKEKKTNETVIISSKEKSDQKKTVAKVQINKQEEKLSEVDDTYKKSYTKFEFNKGWTRSLVSFAVVILLIILPVYMMNFYEDVKEAKGQVLGISTSAYDYLKEAGSFASTSNFTDASNAFSQAAQSFSSAQYQLEQTGGVILDIAKLVPNQAKTADSLLSAGQKLSSAGVVVTNIVGKLEEMQINPLDEDSSSLTDFLYYIKNELNPVVGDMKSAIEDIKNVRIEDLPDEYQNTMTTIKNNLPSIENGLDNLFSLTDVMLEILGHQSPQRYLLIFQNNREIRPTGGFIGSLALMDIYKGKIENLEVPGGGIYDVAGQLAEKIISPKPMWLVNPHWNIQDSNWFVDFPTSAEKINWFYERTGKASVNGVIAITPEVIVGLLEITGPIEMPEYGKTIDSSNFIRTTQYQAEVAYDREENQPKKLIGDLLPIIFDKIFSAEAKDFLQVIDVFSSSLSDKSMILNFNDPELQSAIEGLSWAGQIKETDKDYLMVVTTNIAGGKTDHVVDQLVTHQAQIAKDGSIIDTVTISRTHQGNQLDLFEGQDNVAYMRIYVPAGSELISVEGFDEMPSFRYLLPDEDAVMDEQLKNIEQNSIINEESGTRITDEFGKKVYGNWISIAPGETQELVITYKLPFRLDFQGLFDKSDSYSLFVQKQPGQLNNYFISEINLNESLEYIWAQDNIYITDKKAEYITDLDTDKYYGLLISK